MIYGVIDVGTNTIRTAVYNDDGTIQKNGDFAQRSEILENTKEEILTPTGISKLVISINKASDFLKQMGVNSIFCFATSAMRGIKNFDQVRNSVLDECKILIELLSEKDEAMCDFYGLKAMLGEDCCGIGVDLGGGSCQIVAFRNGDVLFYKSLPIGVKRMYNKFGEYCDEVKEEFFNYIKNAIYELPEYDAKRLYLMGGTAKIIAQAESEDKGKKISVFERFEFPTADYIKKFSQRYFGIAGERTKTLSFGAGIIDVICGYFNIEKIETVNVGVRDGYMSIKMIK